MKKISKVDSRTALVELPPTLYGKLDGKTGYDVYTKFGLPARATPTLAGVLKRYNWDNVRQITPQSYEGRGKITKAARDDVINGADVLCISAITRTAPQSMELARRYKSANPDGIVIAGGMDPSYRAEEWMNYCDVIVQGEGEKTFKELMDRLEGGEELGGLEGVTFKNSRGNIVKNPPRKLMSAEELSRLPLPEYDDSTIRGINVWPVEQERGCPYNCEFCLVTATYGKKIRNRSPERVIDDIRRNRSMKTAPTFFTGDNLAGSPKPAIEMLEAVGEAGLYRDGQTAQISVGAAKNPRLLQAMRNIGIRNLCVGFESINDASLKDLRKPFTSRQNSEAVKIFHDFGFWIHGMMMMGSDSDTPEVARETQAWANNNLDSLQLFIPTPLKGTPFWDRMISEKRIITNDLSLYDAQHCVIRPAHFTPFELQRTVFDIYDNFYSTKETAKRILRSPVPKFTMAFWAWSKLFGGLKGITRNPQTLEHLENLKKAG